MCFDENNTIMLKVANFLNFQYSGISNIEGKKIISYKKMILKLNKLFEDIKHIDENSC